VAAGPLCAHFRSGFVYRANTAIVAMATRQAFKWSTPFFDLEFHDIRSRKSAKGDDVRWRRALWKTFRVLCFVAKGTSRQ